MGERVEREGEKGGEKEEAEGGSGSPQGLNFDHELAAQKPAEKNTHMSLGMVPLVPVTLGMQLGMFTKPHGFPKSNFFIFFFSVSFSLRKAAVQRLLLVGFFFISQMARSYTCPPIYSWCSQVGSPNRMQLPQEGTQLGAEGGNQCSQEEDKNKNHTTAQFQPPEWAKEAMCAYTATQGRSSLPLLPGSRRS